MSALSCKERKIFLYVKGFSFAEQQCQMTIIFQLRKENMDKIYSRTRIHFPKVAYRGKNGNRNYEKIIKIILILTIAICVMVNMLNAINPIFERICKDKAVGIVTVEVNRLTTVNADRYQDSEMITIKQDENGNIQLLQVNSRPLNNMISDITNDIQKSLEDNDKMSAYIPLGSITGVKWLSGVGPNIPIKLALSGTIGTKIRNEFDDAGINQTIHRLWLDITCNVNILTPYEVIETQVANEIILSENVIIGGVPNVYLDADKE